MSRRVANADQARIAQNQQTIKSLLKLECNKICADCKRNKHPRWASWNIGIFVCIRCSGIHRSMGTHISRVKSVDLDSWTDEQVASVLAWGNARANKYWEAKLANGHIPSENKIENFIRTKYELKRWTMDGPRPDPSTLDADGDEDIPLSLVKEKHNIERKESIRKASIGQGSSPARRGIPPPAVDLIGGDSPSMPPPSSGSPAPTKATPRGTPKQNNARDSLLGLDFMGDSSSTPPRPSSTSTVGSGATQSRPDLKQSILSLYASAPRPQAQAQQPVASGFGGMGSPTHNQSSMSGLNDAFGGLNFGAPAQAAPAAAAPPKPVDPFAGLGFGGSSKSPPPASNNNAFNGLGGGSFFDTKPAAPVAQPAQSSFGGFSNFSSPSPAASKPTTSSAMGDLFDLSTPAPAAPAAAPVSNASAFNLSSSVAAPVTSPISNATAGISSNNAWSGSDVWGSNAWGSDTKAEPAKPVMSSASMTPAAPAATSSANDFGWGSSFASTPIVPGASGGFSVGGKPAAAVAAAVVTADDEFGGWASSTTTTANNGNKGFGGVGNDPDLFSNVWQ